MTTESENKLAATSKITPEELRVLFGTCRREIPKREPWTEEYRQARKMMREEA